MIQGLQFVLSLFSKIKLNYQIFVKTIINFKFTSLNYSLLIGTLEIFQVISPLVLYLLLLILILLQFPVILIVHYNHQYIWLGCALFFHFLFIFSHPLLDLVFLMVEKIAWICLYPNHSLNQLLNCQFDQNKSVNGLLKSCLYQQVIY